MELKTQNYNNFNNNNIKEKKEKEKIGKNQSTTIKKKK